MLMYLDIKKTKLGILKGNVGQAEKTLSELETQWNMLDGVDKGHYKAKVN